MIHKSCDIDWRVWCCWQYRAGYLIIGDCSCLGHCFGSHGNCLALSRANALFPFFVCAQFQVRLPGSWEAKHTTSFWCYPFRIVSVFHSSSWIFLFTPRIFSLTPMGSGDAILCADHPILGQVVMSYILITRTVMSLRMLSVQAM